MTPHENAIISASRPKPPGVLLLLILDTRGHLAIARVAERWCRWLIVWVGERVLSSHRLCTFFATVREAFLQHDLGMCSAIWESGSLSRCKGGPNAGLLVVRFGRLRRMLQMGERL